MKHIKKAVSLLLVVMLTAAACTLLVSCDKKSGEGDNTTKTINVKVIDDKGKTTEYSITTTAGFLRGALEQEKLVEGEEGDYGLNVKKVNGLRADYDLDGAYWSFTKGGSYLMQGVDTTPISDGDVFEITYVKA